MTAFVWRSAWPDLIAGIRPDAAREMWQAARDEHRAAEA